MSEYEKMLRGERFDGADTEIAAIRDRTFDLLTEINRIGRFDQTRELYSEMLGALGEGSVMTPPFRCEFGKPIRIGANSFLNMNVLMLDGGGVEIGDNVLVGPNAQFYTSSHSLDHRSRRKWETFCKPIRVEDDVWIGGNVILNGGVNIGARSIIASGAVVNHDIPPDVVAGGMPAKVIRRLDDG